jgi:hypothetical protein
VFGAIFMALVYVLAYALEAHFLPEVMHNVIFHSTNKDLKLHTSGCISLLKD